MKMSSIISEIFLRISVYELVRLVSHSFRLIVFDDWNVHHFVVVSPGWLHIKHLIILSSAQNAHSLTSMHFVGERWFLSCLCVCLILCKSLLSGSAFYRCTKCPEIIKICLLENPVSIHICYMPFVPYFLIKSTRSNGSRTVLVGCVFAYISNFET
jgi:hypothetical protein